MVVVWIGDTKQTPAILCETWGGVSSVWQSSSEVGRSNIVESSIVKFDGKDTRGAMGTICVVAVCCLAALGVVVHPLAGNSVGHNGKVVVVDKWSLIALSLSSSSSRNCLRSSSRCSSIQRR